MIHLSQTQLCAKLAAPIFHLVGEEADRLGYECYVVGGYVRDLFLERPSKDIDIVVVGSGIEIARAVARRLGRKAHLSVFRNFGTAQVKIRDKGVESKDKRVEIRDKRVEIKDTLAATVPEAIASPPHSAAAAAPTPAAPTSTSAATVPEAPASGPHSAPTAAPAPTAAVPAASAAIIEIEFVGARRESYSHDSRKPIVEDGTLEDDQNRRDFTINAMAVCLNAPRFGELVDPFDGVWDLEDRLIATPLDPDITFSDDPLRMMRCIRFATQLNFEIEDDTFEALRRNRERIGIISQERIIDELQKIMASDAPARGFELLFSCGLLELIMPELYALHGVETVAGTGHKDNFWHTLQVLTNVVRAQKAKAETEPHTPAAADPLYLRWAALLHDIGKARTRHFEPGTGWTFHNHDFVGQRMVPDLFRRMKLPLDERMKYVQKLVGLHMRPIVIADDVVTDSAVRRLLFEAGDDIDDLMTLCEADITTRNNERRQRFLHNFQLVRQKLVDLEERDRIRNFQPPVSGEEIMARYHLQPSREVGTLKEAIKNAILDGIVPNEHEAALQFVDEQARQMGLLPGTPAATPAATDQAPTADS